MSKDGPPPFEWGGSDNDGSANDAPGIGSLDDDVTIPATSLSPVRPEPVVQSPPPANAVADPPGSPSPVSTPAAVSSPQTAPPAGAAPGRKVPVWAIAVVAVGLLLVGAVAVFLTVLSGGGDVLVREQRSNGNYDLHLANFGDELGSDTEIESNVALTGQFLEFGELGTYNLGAAGIEFDGGQLIGLQDDDEAILAIVRNGELTEIVDGDGSLLVTAVSDSTAVATFRDDEGGRCTVYRVDGIEADRIARGDACSSGPLSVAITDNGDVSVIDFDDFSEVEIGETDSFLQSSIDADIFVLTESDDDGTADLTVVSVASGVEESVSLDDDQDLVTVMNQGVLIGTQDEELEFALTGSQVRNVGFGRALGSLTYISAAGGAETDILDSGGAIGVVANPARTGLILFQSETFDRQEDMALWAWNEGWEQAHEVGGIDGLRLAKWVDTSTLLVVDWEGVVQSVRLDGTITDLGDLEDFEMDDVRSLFATLTHDGGMLVSSNSFDEDARELHWLIDPVGELLLLTEVDSLNVVSTQGATADRLVVRLREDSDDDEWLLAELVNGRLAEFDEAEGFFSFQFEGGDLLYAARTGDDEDDVEVRRYSIGSSDDPEVVFAEATLRTPHVSGNQEFIHGETIN